MLRFKCFCIGVHHTLAPEWAAATLDRSILLYWPVAWTLPLSQLATGLMRKGLLLKGFPSATGAETRTPLHQHGPKRLCVAWQGGGWRWRRRWQSSWLWQQLKFALAWGVIYEMRAFPINPPCATYSKSNMPNNLHNWRWNISDLPTSSMASTPRIVYT